VLARSSGIPVNGLCKLARSGDIGVTDRAGGGARSGGIGASSAIGAV
jgi:hypothetical protein